MLVRGSNHCCCKKESTPCVSQVDLWDDELSLDEVDDPNGTTPVDSEYDDNVNAFMISGEGSVTVKVSDVIDKIHVYAHITSLVSGSAGVTIRRVDSDESISLWWLGGTSYELRKGSTVLESIVGSGITAKIKLELSTPLDPTTDVLVYINDILAHTESNITFTLPDTLNLGLVVSGEASVIELETQPCFIPCRLSDYVCDDLGLPTFWRVEASGIGNPTGSPVPCSDGITTFDPCAILNGTYRCANQRRVVANYEGQGGEPDWFIDPFGTGPNMLWPYCVFPSTMPGPFAAYSEMATSEGMKPLPPVPLGKLPYMGRAIRGANDTLPPPYDCEGDLRSSGYSVTTMAGTCEVGVDTEPGGVPLEDGFGNPLARVHAVFRMMIDDLPEPWWVTVRYSKDFRIDTTDFRTEDLTLDFESSDGCGSYPPTVTIVPDPVDTDEDKTYARLLLGCDRSNCEPPVTPEPGSCYVQSINLVDADDNPWRMTAVLGVQFDEATGSWYWEGTATPHPLADTHPTCGDIIFATVKIHCVELEEGAAKSWVLDLTYDGQSSRFPMVEDPEFGYGWEGTTDIICSGQTWDFFAGPLNATSSTYQFGSCEWDACAGPHGYYFGAWLYTECDGGFGYTQQGGWLIFSPTSARPWMSAPVGTVYYSPVPYGYSGEVGGIYMYVESGTVRVQLVDGQLDPIPDGFASVGYTCDPNDGRPVIDDTSPISYLWGFPSPVTSDPFGVCEGTTGFGSWEVVFP